MGWLLVCAGGFLAPALEHGSAIGPYDLLNVLGVTSTTHPYVHNAVASDQIQQFIPWQALSWLQVHAGKIPLWQPANLLGMPLAFNFQSAPFSLAVAVGYAFSLGLAHTATIALELVLAGTGTYVFCRMLRLGILPSVVGATIFELCGAFTIWLGVYEAGCCCFLGWVLAASVALLRGRRRAVPAVLLALGLALAFAAGEPQIDVFFVTFAALFVVVAVVRGWAGDAPFEDPSGRPGGRGARLRVWRRRALVDHALALVAACGLVAPIYLPGIQVLLRSARVHGPYVASLPPHSIVNLVFAWYSGVPTNLASIVGVDDLYVASVYVGAVGLVLALAGLAWVRRRPEVLAFAIAAAVLLVVLFAPPVAAVMRHIPEVKVFRVDLGTTFLDFALAMLAAFGAEALLRAQAKGAPSAPQAPDEVGRWAGRLFGAGTAVLVLLLAALGARLALEGGHLQPAQRSVRTAGFLWPSVGVGACAVVSAALAAQRILAARSERAAGGRSAPVLARATGVVAGRGGIIGLVLVEAAFCVISGAWYLSSTSQPFKVTPDVATLQRAVGTKLVAMGSCPALHAFPLLGLMPDDNAAYGVDEFTDYDPIMTTQYYSSLGEVLHISKTPPAGENALFCPTVSSVRVARYYGASYILEPVGAPGPKGTKLVTVVHGEDVYAVPNSGRATLVPLSAGPMGAEGPDQRVQPAKESVGGTWRIHVDARQRSLLVVRVTSVPGWRATIDGEPLALRTYGTVMVAAVVPAGRHVVILRYWPRLWSLGLVLAAASTVALLAVLAEAARRRPRRRRPSVRAPSPPAPCGAVTPASLEVPAPR